MAAHGSYLESPDTFTSLVVHWSGGRWHLPNSVVIGTAGITLFLVSVFVARYATADRPASFILLLWASLALIPNLVITDQEHFLFSFPLITFLLAFLFQRREPITLALFMAGAFLYALRSSDLWGGDREAWWTAHGALGLGNLLLTGAAFIALCALARVSPDTGR
jgi:hypothetical protein